MRYVIAEGQAHLSVRYPGFLPTWKKSKRLPNIHNLYMDVDQIRERAEVIIAGHRSGEHPVIWLSVRQKDGTTHVWTPAKGWVKK